MRWLNKVFTFDLEAVGTQRTNCITGMTARPLDDGVIDTLVSDLSWRSRLRDPARWPDPDRGCHRSASAVQRIRSDEHLDVAVGELRRRELAQIDLGHLGRYVEFPGEGSLGAAAVLGDEADA